jgi:hypothetical protein
MVSGEFEKKAQNHSALFLLLFLLSIFIKRYNFVSTKQQKINLMKKLVVIAFILFSTNVFSQWGIGFRLGDPSGLTLKHLGGKSAFELSVGRTYIFANDNWYYNRYTRWYTKKHKYDNIEYYNFSESVPIAVQLHFLSQKTISEATSDVGDLDWYLGFGAQCRFQNYIYDYQYKNPGDPAWHYVVSEKATDIDLCADGVVGLEYRFSKAPFSVFLDFTLSMEIYNDPFWFYGQGGIGGRYNF